MVNGCTLYHTFQVENELKSVLSQWEQDHERYLIVRDERYLDTIERQWGEKRHLEEQEKLEKVRSGDRAVCTCRSGDRAVCTPRPE